MTGMLEVIIHITRNKQWQCRYCMRKEKDTLKEEVSDQGKGGHQEMSCVQSSRQSVSGGYQGLSCFLLTAFPRILCPRPSD